MIVYILIGLIVVSFMLALISLRRTLSYKELKHTKAELKKGKVIFKR